MTRGGEQEAAILKRTRKKIPAAKVTSQGGYRIVAAPKSKRRREALSGADIAASGGARTRVRQPVH